uniref:Reverse transcriptase domain-containing protein n=1 Tax=Lactuca sativa TaxID=4236 RepID=A0A9R1UD16_LACSA|nr:hypothetical protein LSAT_V11C900464980 [Lactuca sativa]
MKKWSLEWRHVSFLLLREKLYSFQKKQLHHLEHLRNIDLKQKLRIKWDVEGENSSFSMESSMETSPILKLNSKISKKKKNSPEDNELLEADFSPTEIKTIWSCASDKAPGPYDFPFKFLKDFWNIIQFDFIIALRKFKSTGNISRGCYLSFIFWIPKVQDPTILKDFRPISLIRCFTKVISKLLTIRLKRSSTRWLVLNKQPMFKDIIYLMGLLL